jgi:P27 family predicted phage terminase small subunit
MEAVEDMTQPTPTALKIARGNPAKRAIRPEPEPEQLEQLPEPPAILGAAAAAEWRRLAPLLMQLGLLTKVDLPMFTAFCATYGKWFEAEEQLRQGGQSTWQRISESASKEMRQYATEFGLTPASRTRLAGFGGDKPASKFQGLLAS